MRSILKCLSTLRNGDRARITPHLILFFSLNSVRTEEVGQGNWGRGNILLATRPVSIGTSGESQVA